MRFRQRVAVQGPTEVRSPSGSVSYTFETLDGMESIPANIQASTDEVRGEQLTVLTDLFDIDLGGHFPTLEPEMVVLDGESVYDIKRVVSTLRRELTVVKAQRVAI